jgi:serine/threonine protein kinase
MINIGQKGSIRDVFPLGQESPFLVQYLEMFYYENFFCLVIEYCESGDLQQELDSGKQYEERVFYSYLFLFQLFIFLGDKKVVGSYWLWSFKASLI